MNQPAYLDFEDPIRECDQLVAEAAATDPLDLSSAHQTRKLRRQRTECIRRLYATLTPWQRVQVARHPDRPHADDLIHAIASDFAELHGDRRFGDDHAILTGFGVVDGVRVMLIGHRKGHNPKERADVNFGSPYPEGYRKALLKMKLAEKYGLPVVCLIDTAGAYPGVEAEQRGQHQAIAENLMEMSRLRTPIVCVIVGEGGSGGALGIGVGDHVAMFENAYYSVISPEGCAGILWKDRDFAEAAAKSLKLTSNDLLRFGVIDEVLPEPLGGGHRDPLAMASRLKYHVSHQLTRLKCHSNDELVGQRYERFRKIGEYSPNGRLPLIADNPAILTGMPVNT